jgi:hypothetical protein
MTKIFALASFLLLAATLAWGGITVTAEAVGVQTSQVPAASVYGFDDQALYATLLNFSHAFGSVTATYDKVYVREPNAYGGASATRYPACADAFADNPYTITLSSPVNYFGMFWTAGDNGNKLDFYLGTALVASFTTSTAVSVLGSGYLGNPNNSMDGAEKFAYLNFFGTNGTTFNKIVLTSTIGGNGFESDNHAFAVSATPSGSVTITSDPTPTPSAVPALSPWAMAVLALLMVAMALAMFRLHRPAAR